MKRFTQLAIAGALGVGLSCVASASPVVLKDGVLVTERAIYTMKPAGGMQAIGVEDGRVLWSSAEADRPVQVFDGHVLAQRDSGKHGELVLQFLDANDGAAKARRTVELPAEVLASIDDRLSTSFSLSVPSDALSQLVWRYEQRPAQGMIDVVDGPALKRNSGFLRIESDALDVSETTVRALPRRSYDRVAQVDFAGANERAFYSEDRRHVLVSSRVEGSRGYQWRVHDTQGVLLGQWLSKVSFAPFVVRGDRALFMSTPGARSESDAIAIAPLQLVAVDVASGKRAWSHEVRDTRYTGPMAP